MVWTAAAQGKAHDEAHDELIARISAYIAKATKEAKVHTSWVNPNEDYDRALSKFVSAILKPGSHLRFLNKFAPLLQRVAYYGQFNALAQLLLKLTAPGVPDIYQGNERWDFSLVDPDNRRPVDYEQHRQLLDGLKRRVAQAEGEPPGGDLRALAQELVEQSADGRIKLFVTYRTLDFRQEQAALIPGRRLPGAQGHRAASRARGSLCAHGRRVGGRRAGSADSCAPPGGGAGRRKRRRALGPRRLG